MFYLVRNTLCRAYITARAMMALSPHFGRPFNVGNSVAHEQQLFLTVAACSQQDENQQQRPAATQRPIQSYNPNFSAPFLKGESRCDLRA